MKNRKTKIGLVLLITLAFLLPTVPLSADSPTGPDAEDGTYYNPKNVQTSGGIAAARMNADGEIIPLEYDAGWPVEVDDILIDPIIAEGTYDITARFCRPDYSDVLIGKLSQPIILLKEIQPLHTMMTI
jgi:hypothetical protein